MAIDSRCPVVRVQQENGLSESSCIWVQLNYTFIFIIGVCKTGNSTVADSPLISVVIPCYNAERYLAAAIDSILAQQHPSLEIIVVDDGSRDGSCALVERDYPGVRLERQANAGAAAARNRGIALARGSWVAFLDADDIWLPGKLAAQWDQLQAHPECRLNYTAWQVWRSDAPRPDAGLLAQLDAQRDDLQRWAGASGWVYPQLMLDCVVWTGTVLAQRSLLQELGGFDTSLHVGEDYDLWLRASRLTPILRVAQPYALYRLHPASITHQTPRENYRARVIGLALARWGTRSPDGSNADLAAIRRALARSWSDFGAAALAIGDGRRSRASAWRALREDPAHLPGWKLLVKALLPRRRGTTA